MDEVVWGGATVEQPATKRAAATKAHRQQARMSGMIPDAPGFGKDVVLSCLFTAGWLKCPMRTTRPWLFVFLPILYVAIVLSLIAVQFSKKNASFSQSLGDLTIAGKSAAAGEPADITLMGRGLVFLFDAAHYLQADGRDGTSSRLRPLSWTWKDGSAVVTFQQNLQLMFEKAGTDALLIHPVANDDLKKFATLHIPFGAGRGSRLNRDSRGSFVEIVTENARMVASVDGVQDRIDADAFVLTSGGTGFQPARVDASAGLTPDLAWATAGVKADPVAAETALGQYWDRAYKGWASAPTFTSRLADAWAREALSRGDYPAVFDRIDGLRRSSGSAWTFDAASYLGNIIELTIQKRRDVEAASSRSQPDWAGQGELWSAARLYGPDGSADRVKGLLVQGKIPDDTPNLVAFLRNLLALQALQPSDAVAARVDDVQHAVLAKLVRREGDLFVQSSPGILDLRSGLILGRLWLDAAKNLGNQAYGSAGAQLVASALSFQDGGKLPETLVVQDGQIIRQEGTLQPEDLYAAVKPAPDPETELPAWGAGAFVRTPAKITSQTITASSAKFTFRFPAGAAEHIVISGIPAFDHITMHGIRWRTDPDFQQYTDGWYYSASTKTLYVKIKHRQDLEELTVHFTSEE